MILRHAVEDDAGALVDVGDASSSEWLNEVAEIVSGLLAWRDDPAAIDQGREVVVADVDGDVVAAAAHTCLVSESGDVWTQHRYPMGGGRAVEAAGVRPRDPRRGHDRAAARRAVCVASTA